jgi:MraZ protein
MFRGSFPHTIDEKGRVAIPGKWRELLTPDDDNRLILTRFMVNKERCLDVYPYGEWLRFEESMMQQRRFSPTVLKFESYYIARAHDCQIDKQGRVLIPPQLREYAGLDKDVVFTGVLRNFRIWNRESWERVDQAAEQAMADDPGFLEGLGI